MVRLILVVLLAAWVGIFVRHFWHRRSDTLALTHVVMAVLVSSGTTGIWALMVAPVFVLLPRPTRPATCSWALARSPGSRIAGAWAGRYSAIASVREQFTR